MRDFDLIQMTLLLLLAGAGGILWRRLREQRHLLAGLETEHELLKRTLQALAGTLEERHAPAPRPLPDAPSPQRSLSRGEADLLRKVRLLGSPSGSATPPRTLATPRR